MYGEIYTNRRDVKLYDAPHYSDRRFDRDQTVFGKLREDLNYDYSDRLVEWDYDKHEAAIKSANETKHVKRSAAWYEHYLSEYFGKPVKLVHVIAGVNRGNGYPYIVFGYEVKS